MLQKKPEQLEQTCTHGGKEYNPSNSSAAPLRITR